MKIDIRNMNEFLKFVFIRSLMNWERENKKKLLSKKDIIDMKFTVNNTELNIVDVFKSYEENMDLYIKIEARKLIEKRFSNIEYDMDNIIYNTLEKLKIEMIEKLNTTKQHHCFGCGVILTKENFTEKQKEIFKRTGIEVCINCDYDKIPQKGKLCYI